MEKNFKREINALEAVFAFVDDFLSANGVSERIALSIKLVVEELFTNLVRHNITEHDHITLCLDRDSDQLIIRLKDYDVEPFEMPEEEVDVRKPLDERKVGGLGIHLVKNIVDKLTYEYMDRTLLVTVIKKLEDGDV